ILGSGHNIAPEPIENEILQNLPGARQIVLIGNGRGYLSAIVTGEVTRERVQMALDRVNSELPHYKEVRAFYVSREPFSNEIGLLTLEELEKFVAALEELVRESHTLIIYSTLSCGFCAGADLRELYRRSQEMKKADAAQGVRNYLERIHRVMNTIDAAPLT